MSSRRAASPTAPTSRLAPTSPTPPRRRGRAAAAAALIVLAAGTSAVVGTEPVSAAPTCAKAYQVVKGDSWFSIAKKSSVSQTALYQVNQASASSPLYPGGSVCLPDTATVPTTTTTVPGSTTTTTIAPAVTLAAFPAQGPCWYTDTWQAPRGGGRLHEGVDIIAKAGQFIYAAIDGTLTRQQLDRAGSLSGNAWWLTGADGTYVFYAHLSAFAPDLAVGSKVVAGQVIGWIGRTGNAAGPHLHFEVHPKGGAPVNPTPIVRAVDGCTIKEPPPQPSGSVPPAPASTLPPASQTGGTTTTTTTIGVPTATTPAAPTTTAPPAKVAPGPPLSNAPGGLWQFIAPATAFDSAWTGKALAGGSRQTVRVSNLSGVPKTTGGVLVRLTAQGAASGGYVSVAPCDGGMPAVSSLSFPAGGSAVGTSMVRVSNGNICVLSNTSVRLKVEVLAAQASSGVGVQPVTATRVLDTRTTTRLVPGASVSLSPTTLGVVAGTRGLTASITFVNPAAAGTFSLGFCGQGPWKSPIAADAVSSFTMTMRVNEAGWCLSSSVATDVIVDVVAVWAGTAAPSPVGPARIYDSRDAGAPVTSGGVGLPVAGVGGVPADATTAVVALTVVTRGSGTSVFAYPCGEGRSSGSVVAVSANRVTTAVVPVRLGGGTLCLSSMNDADVIVDVLGAG